MDNGKIIYFNLESFVFDRELLFQIFYISKEEEKWDDNFWFSFRFFFV